METTQTLQGQEERPFALEHDGGIEASLAVLHTKLDRLVEDAAVARTDIAWLKWGMRLLFAAVLGVGGVAAHAAM
jgi:hypothetical protein